MLNRSQLPSHPKLRPGIDLVTIDHEKVLVRTASRTILLSGEFVASQFPVLLGQLDGSHTLEQLAATLDENARPQLEQFLSIMLEKGILCEEGTCSATTPPLTTPKPNSHGQAYWDLYGGAENETRTALWSSTVVISNLGGIGTSVARALASSGIGNLVLVDPARVTESDHLFGYPARNIGAFRAATIAAQLAEEYLVNVTPISESIDDISNWNEIVGKAHIVALCSDNMSLAGYEKTNEACVRAETRWISARIDRARAIIGPFVVPQQTACFACFELRQRANSEHPDDHSAMYKHWKQVAACPSNWPFIGPFGSIVGNYLALDILRVLGGKHLSAAHGRLLYLDLHGFETQFHEILKIPRCPVCSRLREQPLVKIWDIRNNVSGQAEK